MNSVVVLTRQATHTWSTKITIGMFSGFYNADKDRSPASLIFSITAPLEDRKPAQHFFFQKKVQEILSSGGTDH